MGKITHPLEQTKSRASLSTRDKAYISQNKGQDVHLLGSRGHVIHLPNKWQVVHFLEQRTSSKFRFGTKIKFRENMNENHFCFSRKWPTKMQNLAFCENGRVADHLDAFTAFKLLDWGSEDCGVIPVMEPKSWDGTPDLFGLKISRDLARALILMQASLTVSRPVCLNMGDNSNHNITSPFCHLVFTSSDIQFVSFIDRVLSPYTVPITGF